MKSSTLLLSAAIAGLLSSNAAHAADAPVTAKEKCYGIAKAGKNDCHAADGSHSCAYQSKKDNDPNAFVMVEKDTCETQGGKTTPPQQ